MTENYEYLSDESLEQLIAEVERNEMIMAPPDLLEQILEQIPNRSAEKRAAEARPAEIRSTENRSDGCSESHVAVPGKSGVREFHQYCLRVILSVAAALVIVFTLPALQSKYRTTPTATGQWTTAQEEEDFQIKRGTLLTGWDQKAEERRIWGEYNDGNPAKNAGKKSEKQIFREAMAGFGIFQQSDRYSIFQ